MRTESVSSRLTRSAQGVSLSVQGVSFNESGPSRLPQGVSSSSSPPVMRTESRLATALFAWDHGAAAANPRWRAEQETNKRVARMRIIAAKFHTGNLMIKAFRRGGWGTRFFGCSFGYFTTGLGRRLECGCSSASYTSVDVVAYGGPRTNYFPAKSTCNHPSSSILQRLWPN